MIWTGHTDVNAREAEVCPDLLPVRIRSGAFGPGAPGDPLVVSTDHRVLITGGGIQDLFNSDEILVAARKLTDDRNVRRIPVFGHIRYHHIMLATHQVIWANGLACETFHPSDADLFALNYAQRLALIEAAPDTFRNAASYGPHARRCLSRAEATLLLKAA